jgi:hypothetical protein
VTETPEVASRRKEPIGDWNLVPSDGVQVSVLIKEEKGVARILGAMIGGKIENLWPSKESNHPLVQMCE